MKKLFTFALAICMAGAMVSCNQNTAVVGADMDKKIDSLKQAGMEKLHEEMDAACKERMAGAEFQSKVDSIMTAMKAAA